MAGFACQGDTAEADPLAIAAEDKRRIEKTISCRPRIADREPALQALFEIAIGNAFEHGGRGPFCPVSENRLSKYSLHQISRLS